MQPIVNIDDGDQFIIIEDDGPDDIEILGNSPFTRPTQASSQVERDPSKYSSRTASKKNGPSPIPARESRSSMSQTRSFAPSTLESGKFNLSTGGDNVATPGNRSRLHSRELSSGRAPRSLSSLSPISTSLGMNSHAGSANCPADVTGSNSANVIDLSDENATKELHRRNRNVSSSSSVVDQYLFWPLLDHDEEVSRAGSVSEAPSALHRSRTQHPASNDVLIDLDDFDERWSEEPELQTLSVQETPNKDGSTPPRRESCIKIYPYRNPPISYDEETMETLPFGNLTLRPCKSVELPEGDFLRIQGIVRNVRTGEVKLRGHRLQRCSAMNGMLERKLNEVCLFYEVDLDDPRHPLEQSVVEVPVNEVRRIRNIRWTNQKFPRDRNVEPVLYENQRHVASDGGLTVRWKYTCKYPSAAHRYRNDYIERTLEHITEDEVSGSIVISDAVRRFEWRGETIPGGAYQPRNAEENWSAIVHEESPISIASSSPEPESGFFDPELSGSLAVATNNEPDLIMISSMKRKLTAIETPASTLDTRRPSKRGRFDAYGVEKTTEGIKSISLDVDPKGSRKALTIQVPEGRPIIQSQSCTATAISSTEKRASATTCISVEGETTSLVQAFNTEADQPATLKLRSDGQMLTYGDAFCGGGGTTRGAAMAGLRVKWGFDFNSHACLTWRENFPQARCFNIASNQFVSTAQRAAKRGFPDAMKVDILHLSPPCQYFSDAHTVDGKDDEMNVASLFAVREVIDVAKPRVVTLEQTFGITRSRFVWYLAALIQMFTSLDFSVRWAVVHLAQWGLPQRRKRLIIIASCPGEILPKMPAATHSEDEGNGLKPFVTVNRTLSKIPPNAPDHNPDELIFPDHRRMKPWDGNTILPRTMTTSGGQNYHPSGVRDFTLREYASLQGFPPNHVFKGSYVKKQIGNAVPPCVAKVLFESIKRDLDKTDGIAEEHETMLIE